MIRAIVKAASTPIMKIHVERRVHPEHEETDFSFFFDCSSSPFESSSLLHAVTPRPMNKGHMYEFLCLLARMCTSPLPQHRLQ